MASLERVADAVESGTAAAAVRTGCVAVRRRGTHAARDLAAPAQVTLPLPGGQPSRGGIRRAAVTLQHEDFTMSVGRLAAASIAASLFAAAAGAQTPGTLEVGGFGQYNIFDDRVDADNEIGIGGRVGVFFLPRWSIEGEGSYTELNYNNAGPNVREEDTRYSPLALRLNYHFPFATNSAFILGAGVTRSDYHYTYNYGPSVMAGARIGLGRVLALRVDGVYNYLPDESAKINEIYARAGLSALIPGSMPMAMDQQAQMGGAPQPGTVELGGFGQYSLYDNDMNYENGFGYGARLGAFVTPVIEPEVDFSYTEADREAGRGTNLRIVPLAARLNFNFPFGARNAFILGGGATRTFYDNESLGGTYNWGPSGLAGIRIGLGQRVALRLDGVADYLVEPKFANFAARAGLSLMLGGARPSEPIPQVVETPVDTTTLPPAIDSTAIRDSLAREEEARRLREAQDAARAALQAVIYFDFDRSNIRQDAASALDAKLPLLQANPEMRIRIVGNTDTRGSDEYNLALGQRRAAAARRYLTQRGIDASRIEITSRGEENPVAANATQESEHQQNRRDEFEIVIGGENIMVPGMAPGAAPSPSMAPAPSAAPADSAMMMRDSAGMMRDSAGMMMDSTRMRDSAMTPPATPPSTPPSNTLAPATTDTLSSTTAPAREPSTTPTPDSTSSPVSPAPVPTTPAAPAPGTPPDSTATPRTPPTTPSTPPATPPTR